MDQIIDQLNKFIESQKIDDSILVSILKRLILEYPNETLRQHAIRATILFFEEKYKDEYENIYNYKIKKKRELSKNEFTANKENDIRLTFSVPGTLLARIESLLNKLRELGKLPKDEPHFMSNESIKLYQEDQWFKNNFQKYVIPEKF